MARCETAAFQGGVCSMDFVQLFIISQTCTCHFFSLLNPSKHNTNELCIITFNGALLHVSASGRHHQAEYNKHIPNY
jgi:hypothetical protein